MPKVAYSEQERAQIRKALLETALELMAKQGIQHTTVEQIYRQVGISRSFFYSFFATKEDLIVEMLYLQQPHVLAYARQLVSDPQKSWKEAVRQFLVACCYGEKNKIAVLTLQEQQMLFRRLRRENYQLFRQKQLLLFQNLLECFGILPSFQRVALFTNLSLAVMVVRRAIPDTLPLFIPQAADETAAFQIDAIVNCLEQMRQQDLLQSKPK